MAPGPSQGANDAPSSPPRTYTPSIDLAERFGLEERKAVLLHPRQARIADAGASKLGGQFAWPAGAQWPRCAEHGDTVVPVLQLRAADVPELGFPPRSDLFQLVWCPAEHAATGYGPLASAAWRPSGGATGAQPPRARPAPELDCSAQSCVPAECALFPERVAETRADLPRGALSRIADALHEDGAADFDAMRVPESYRGPGAYETLLSCAPGTKVGGWCAWVQAEWHPECGGCGAEMEHLLTVASGDVGDGVSGYRWAPSDVARDERGFRVFGSHRGSELCIGDAGKVYVFVCRECDEWPIACEMQCS